MEAHACAALLAELRQAMELLKQLELNMHCLDLCKDITPRIASSIHNSIIMAESFSTNAFRDQPRAETPRRRKSLRSWRRRVRLSSVSGGVEGRGEDDGFTWRKYGQKKIFGAKHPRSYFRCARHFSHACPAKKQVQRSDDDPSVYDVTYHDDHTCLEQPREEDQGGALGAIQHDQEPSAAALNFEGEEEFGGQIAPSFEPVEEQFLSASPYQFGAIDEADSSLLPMEIDGDLEIDPDSIWAGVE